MFQTKLKPFLYRHATPGIKKIILDLRTPNSEKYRYMISSYPKSGSTYLRFLIDCYINDRVADYDAMEEFIPYSGAKIRSSTVGNYRKTHELPISKYRQGVYIERDPREVVWSLYRSQIRRKMFRGSLSDYVELFAHGWTTSYGSWLQHSISWREHVAEGGDWLSIKYRDLVTQPEEVLGQVLHHSGVMPCDDRLRRAVDGSTVENVRQAEARSVQFGSLMAKGAQPIVGDGAISTRDEVLSSEDLKLLSSHLRQW